MPAGRRCRPAAGHRPTAPGRPVAAPPAAAAAAFSSAATWACEQSSPAGSAANRPPAPAVKLVAAGSATAAVPGSGLRGDRAVDLPRSSRKARPAGSRRSFSAASSRSSCSSRSCAAACWVRRKFRLSGSASLFFCLKSRIARPAPASSLSSRSTSCTKKSSVWPATPVRSVDVLLQDHGHQLVGDGRRQRRPGASNDTVTIVAWAGPRASVAAAGDRDAGARPHVVDDLVRRSCRGRVPEPGHRSVSRLRQSREGCRGSGCAAG